MSFIAVSLAIVAFALYAIALDARRNALLRSSVTRNRRVTRVVRVTRNHDGPTTPLEWLFAFFIMSLIGCEILIIARVL